MGQACQGCIFEVWSFLFESYTIFLEEYIEITGLNSTLNIVLLPISSRGTCTTYEVYYRHPEHTILIIIPSISKSKCGGGGGGTHELNSRFHGISPGLKFLTSPQQYYVRSSQKPHAPMLFSMIRILAN